MSDYISDLGGGCSAAEPYALRVIGDSMAPEFNDGHIIIVDPGMPLINGAYVVMDVAGETTFRQFVIEGERKVLRALNSGYPDMELDGAWLLRGVVIQRGGRRRSEIKHYDYKNTGA